MSDLTPPELHEARQASLGSGMIIRRALPIIKQRMIGPWCFLDHFGPASFTEPHDGMWVGPHPHIGLQTVTWMIQGQVLHRDSLGSEQLIQAEQLNIMTSGRGISHTEESPTAHSGQLHGVQLWVALPDEHRHAPPSFEHHEALPVLTRQSLKITVFAGQGFKERSPATVYSPMLGAELLGEEPAKVTLPLEASFEHGLILTEGSAVVQGRPLGIGQLAYLAPGPSELVLETGPQTRLILIGGRPFQEPVLLWWNFVGRTAQELQEAREQWLREDPRFGQVRGFQGDRLVAPEWVPGLKP